MMNQCDPKNEPLIAYDEALNSLIECVSPTTKIVARQLLQALGEVLAEDQYSAIDVPSTDNSAMDGYAFNTADLTDSGETVLPVSQRIAAGTIGATLASGTAARIFTGAPVPPGADAVIMQEQAILADHTIRFERKLVSGENVRPAGNDIRSGDRILNKGRRLRPQELGIAASIGLQSLPVFEKIRVGIFFTGDELVEPGQDLGPGMIYDSNRYTLHGLLQALGCEIIDCGLVGDTLEATKAAMLEASRRADLVVTCGGVSVGEEDHVRNAVEQLGDLQLWRVRIKPGKPLAFGNIKQTPFVGLPGNPVSVFATFMLFVCPLIKNMQGRLWEKPLATRVVAGFDWPKPDSRREFLRARLETIDDQALVARIYPNQDSGVLTSTVWAQGFVEIAEGQTIKAGELIDYLSFEQILN